MRVHLSVAEARALSERAMRGIGYEAEEARILAEPDRPPHVAAPPMVAPPGGARPALGTNPIAFGFPLEGDPIRIPGERAYRERARRSRDGIEIDRRIQDALIQLAEGRT